jgi:hypothetical protein
MKTVTHHTIVLICMSLVILFLSACRPLQNMKTAPHAWEGVNTFSSGSPVNDKAKKNVFIVADYKLTELLIC